MSPQKIFNHHTPKAKHHSRSQHQISKNERLCPSPLPCQPHLPTRPHLTQQHPPFHPTRRSISQVSPFPIYSTMNHESLPTSTFVIRPLFSTKLKVLEPNGCQLENANASTMMNWDVSSSIFVRYGIVPLPGENGTSHSSQDRNYACQIRRCRIIHESTVSPLIHTTHTPNQPRSPLSTFHHDSRLCLTVN